MQASPSPSSFPSVSRLSPSSANFSPFPAFAAATAATPYRRFATAPNYQKTPARRTPRSRSNRSAKSRARSAKSRKRTTPKLSTPTRRNIAARRIATAIVANRPRIQARFLNAVCSDSGACLAFGRESAKIKEYFAGFTDFTYAIDPVVRIGKESANGFINEIVYKRGEYTAHAVLKSSAIADADNLYYEFRVGQFINTKARVFPCFTETYGLYVYADTNIWVAMKNRRSNPIAPLTVKSDFGLFKPDEYMRLTKMSCKYSKYFAILIQHFADVVTLADKIRVSKTDARFMTVDMPCILYQVYAVLGVLALVLSHEDLHDSNVLVYEPFHNGFLAFHYHYPDGTVATFNSPFIAKIIDYGRCWYHNTAADNSAEIYKKVCGEPGCGVGANKCGEKVGYSILNIPRAHPDFYYISALNRNMTIDLRILKYIWEIPGKYSGANAEGYRSILGRVTRFIDDNKGQPIGAKEITQSGIPDPDNMFGPGAAPFAINNVNDAHVAFRKLMEQPYFVVGNAPSQYPGRAKKGDLHIYLDGSQEMRFEPTRVRV